MEPARSADLLLGIGVITYRRPEPLARLLDSVARLDMPAGVTPCLLVAENDRSHLARAVVDSFAERTGWPVRLELEPEQGIPFARNRVLDMALEEGCDLLAFVDDDNIVPPGWIRALHAAMQARVLDLVGGPVYFSGPVGVPLGWQARAVLDVLRTNAGNLRKARKRRLRFGQEDGIQVYTNNWLLRMRTQRRLGVRFDERLRFTGGSDTKFSDDLNQAGGWTGWTPEAMVTEIRPLDRLTLGHTYRRIRDQRINRNEREGRRIGRVAALRRVAMAGLRMLRHGLRAPVTSGRSLVFGIMSLGQAVGDLYSALGRRSRLYDPHKERPRD